MDEKSESKQDNNPFRLLIYNVPSQATVTKAPPIQAKKEIEVITLDDSDHQVEKAKRQSLFADYTIPNKSEDELMEMAIRISTGESADLMYEENTRGATAVTTCSAKETSEEMLT